MLVELDGALAVARQGDSRAQMRHTRKHPRTEEGHVRDHAEEEDLGWEIMITWPGLVRPFAQLPNRNPAKHNRPSAQFGIPQNGEEEIEGHYRQLRAISLRRPRRYDPVRAAGVPSRAVQPVVDVVLRSREGRVGGRKKEGRSSGTTPDAEEERRRATSGTTLKIDGGGRSVEMDGGQQSSYDHYGC